MGLEGGRVEDAIHPAGCVAKSRISVLAHLLAFRRQSPWGASPAINGRVGLWRPSDENHRRRRAGKDRDRFRQHRRGARDRVLCYSTGVWQ
jgi:hypothetical protein